MSSKKKPAKGSKRQAIASKDESTDSDLPLPNPHLTPHQRLLVPRLRFPQFRDPWVQKGLSPYLEDCSSRVEVDTLLPVYTSSRVGLIPQSEYYGGQVRPNDSAYGRVAPHSIVYRHMSDDGIFRFHMNETGGDIAVSKEYPVFRTVGLNAYFLLYKLNYGPDFRAFAIAQKAGGTRTRLYLSKLRSFEMPTPSLPEQQKIAACLSSLDELIGAHSRKLDALKAHKKSLMQQLFPQPGETTPRLRFPEFENAGEWEYKRLSSEIELISGLHLSPVQYSTKGDVPYFTGPSDFTNDIKSVTKWTNRSSNMALPDDILITVKGSGVGEVWYSSLTAVALGRQLMAVRVKRGSSQFVFQFLLTKKTRFEDLGSGNLIPGLCRTDILEMETQFPSSAEQHRIAACLTSLDDLITAQTQKLAALRIHKKGLMQQLFPSPQEAQA